MCLGSLGAVFAVVFSTAGDRKAMPTRLWLYICSPRRALEQGGEILFRELCYQTETLQPTFEEN